MGTVWNSLGTQRAVRVISILMILYLLAIGALMIGYIKVSSCLADYANASAVSTNARAMAAAQDRQLDKAEAVLAESDRVANRAFSKALSRVLLSVGSTKAEQKKAYEDLLAQDKKTTDQVEKNDEQREGIRIARAQNEQERAKNPVPPPPSESC